MDGTTSTRLDDDDCLRLSPVPPPQSGRTEKKESQDRRHNPASQPSGKPSSSSSYALCPCDARTVKSQSQKPTNKKCQSSARLSYPIFRTSTWRSAAAGTLDNVALSERVAYAQFYDGVDNNSRIRNDMFSNWRNLSDFGEAPDLSAEEARQFSHDIREIGNAYTTLASNYGIWKTSYVRALGIKLEEAPSESPVTIEKRRMMRDALCKPLIDG